jgi:AraC-like DNA-binding protein
MQRRQSGLRHTLQDHTVGKGEPSVVSLQLDHVESEFGAWTHGRFRPDGSDPLAPSLAEIWDFDGTLTHRRERTFPNGMAEIIVQLDEPHRPVTTEALAPFPAVCVDGLRTSAAVVEAPAARCRVLGIRLHPFGAYALLGAGFAEITDLTADLRDVIRTGAAELGEMLSDARSGRARIAAALAWVRRRMAGARLMDPRIHSAVTAINKADGFLSIAGLDEVEGRSRSRFASRFKNAVGISPKRFARIVRFARALQILRSVGASPTRAAFDAGYFDQAHMIADFREHAGLTPGQYLAGLRYPESGSLAEPTT